jgi:DNA-binding CsgD family transcriptional regulator
MVAIEAERVMKATEVILDGFHLPDVSRDALTSLTKILGAETAIVFGVDLRAGAMESRSCVHHLTFGEMFKEYRDTYFYSDPFMAAEPGRPALGEGEVRRLSDVVSCLTDTSYYNEFLSKIDIKHKLAVLVPSHHDPRRAFAFGFHRPRALSDFGDAERQILERLRPALSSAVERTVLQELASRNSSVIDDLTAEIGKGVLLILGNDYAILHANAAAQLLIRDGQHSDQVPRSILETCERLKSQATGTMATTVLASLDDQGAIDLSIRYRSGNNAERFVISSASTFPHVEPISERLARFGISRRESQIIEQMVSGHSNKIIAGNLMISPRTVENHIRAIYLKMDVSSRAHMISRIFRLTGEMELQN